MTISVFGELREDGLTRETKEILTQAVELKERLGGPVELVFIASEAWDVDSLCDRWGMDSAVVIRRQKEASYSPESTLKILQSYCRKTRPDLFLFSGGIRGSELAPRLAFRNGAEALLDCTGLSWNGEEELTAIKPIYSGNIFCDYRVKLPAVIALRPHQIPIREIPARKVQIRVEAADGEDLQQSIGERRIIQKCGKGLEEHKIMFVCGRGMESKEQVEGLVRLADKCQAGVGGSKKVIENGWLPVDRMVGQTGRILTPDLCVVWGASGATPFLNGVEGAKRLIAVNQDEEARIFEATDLGLVSDCRRLLEKMEEALESK